MNNLDGSATITLPNDTDIDIVRRFAAPASAVFAAWTTPEQVRQWWTDSDEPMVECTIDLRVGGAWRYVTGSNEHGELAWNGTYREIDPGHRLVYTEVFEGFPDAEAVNTLTLVEADGITTVTINVAHKTRANRDGHIASGMEPGMQSVLDRLDDLLAV